MRRRRRAAASFGSPSLRFECCGRYVVEATLVRKALPAIVPATAPHRKPACRSLAEKGSFGQSGASFISGVFFSWIRLWVTVTREDGRVRNIRHR